MSKRVKEMMVEEISRHVGDSSEFLVVDASRLDAVTSNRFRLGLRENNLKALTVKNSMAKWALHRHGVESLDPVLEGPSTLVWGGEDIVALSKEISRWAKEIEPLEIKGGTVEGKTLTADDVDELSKSPSREELIGQISGLALSVGGRLSAAILGPGGQLCGQVKGMAEGEE